MRRKPAKDHPWRRGDIYYSDQSLTDYYGIRKHNSQDKSAPALPKRGGKYLKFWDGNGGNHNG